MNKMYKNLEFDIILEKLASLALSDYTKKKILSLTPFMKESVVKSKIKETTEAKYVIESFGQPPTVEMIGLHECLISLDKEEMLSIEQLMNIKQFLVACRRMKVYLSSAEVSASEFSLIGRGIVSMEELENEIDRCIRNKQVDKKATNELYNLYKKSDMLNEKIKEKLNSLLTNKKQYFSDSFIVKRSGHYTLPVKKEYKKQVEGTVFDSSNSGNTLFVEPISVRRFYEKLNLVEIEQDNEIIKILYQLTDLCDVSYSDIKMNIESMESLDFIFAKAKFSMDMNGIAATINIDKHIKIVDGIHPLLDVEHVVPLSFELGKDYTGLIITGPNTGGKTVTLKTVGLFSLMVQSGLHIPAKACEMSLFNMVLSDIGDGQSIAENLSTFSSHMTSIIDIIQKADDQTLVLLDELGSGTDPAEGMGLAISVLERLSSFHCLLLATTHYPEIKLFASERPEFVNARMGFDRENLLPLYQLEIGEAGESCAIYIAQKLGLDQDLIERAHQITYSNNVAHITEIVAAKSNTANSKAHKKSVLRFKKIDNNRDTIKKLIDKFNRGDSVKLMPNKEIAIVFEPCNEKGQVGIQCKGKKMFVSHKRIKLYIKATELYPADYDFDIIFDSVSNRKAKQKMGKRHVPELVVTHEKIEE